MTTTRKTIPGPSVPDGGADGWISAGNAVRRCAAHVSRERRVRMASGAGLPRCLRPR